MSYDLAIHLKNVSKQYQIYDKPSDRLRAMFPWNRSKTIGRTFHALHDITVDIAHGEVVGIIGRNGAGKSTLLQIVAQTISPSHGEAKSNGKISALLELGSGFNPEFSGRENVYLAAAIAGLSQEEVDQKFDEIVAFSEIGAFIDQPVKTYSSGMMVRLAFSVATSVKPDILIIDEALSVGDGAFAKKSFDRIMELKESGATILFCSHNLYQLKSLCNRALWIKEGRIAFNGDSHTAVDRYQAFLDSLEQKKEENTDTNTNEDSVLSLAQTGRIVSVGVGKKGENLSHKLSCVSERDDLIIEIAFSTQCTAAEISVAWLITDSALRNISSASTGSDGIAIELDEEGRGTVKITIERCPIMRGEYLLHAFLMSPDDVFYFDSAVNACSIEITDEAHVIGVVKLPRRWESYVGTK